MLDPAAAGTVTAPGTAAAPTEQPATGTTQQAGAGAPPRPVPDQKTIAWVKSWFDQLDDLPEHNLMVEVIKRIEQELMPAWSDPKDPYKGRKSRTVREGEDDRRVNTPLAYLNVQQIVATTVPENHKVRWKPDPEANPSGLGADKLLSKYAKSQGSILEKFTREVQWQDRLEGWVQEACIYPMGVAKLYFERNTKNEPVTQGNRVEQDGQDDADRIQQIMQDLAANRIQPDAPEVVELADLLAAQGKVAEVEIRTGLVLQSVPLKRMLLPRGCTVLEDIYLAPWMGEEVEMTRRNIRKRYPFTLNPDGSWTGIHPDDLNEAQKATSTLKGRKSVNGRGMRGADTGNRNTIAMEDQELTLIEVWDRESGYVYVFLRGVNYHIAKWIPEKTPEQWFPYHILVLDRLPGQVAGVSKVELQMDEQARINRKRSDEEKARYHSQPKGIADSTYWDEEKQSKSVNIKPYTLKGLPLGGNKIQDVVQWFSTPMVPEAYNTIQDRQDLNRAANISAQSLGVTGEADFAVEVEQAAQGTAISGQAIKNRIRRGLERLYDAAMQLIQQEVTCEEALELDPTVVWPKVYGDGEAQQLYKTIRQEVRAGLLPGMMQAYAPQMDPTTQQLTTPNMPPPAEIERQLYEQAEPLVQEKCLATFGVPKPLSRESLYRRLRVHVTVALDAQVDRNKRLNGLMKLFESAAGMIQAADAAGTHIDIIPLMKQLAPLVEADEDLVDEMFSPDPNASASMLLQVLTKGGTVDPQLGVQLAEILTAQAAQQVAPPGAPARGAPARGAPAPGAAGGQAPAAPPLAVPSMPPEPAGDTGPDPAAAAAA